MKRLFTILVFVLSVSIVTFSQDFAKKGTWELGGSVGFTSSTSVFRGTNDPNGAVTTFSISPEVGYLITNNFEVALLPFHILPHHIMAILRPSLAFYWHQPGILICKAIFILISKP